MSVSIFWCSLGLITLVCVFREYYITMVKWATSTKVAVTWLNRAQNVSILTLCDATTGVCTKVQYWDSEGGEEWLLNRRSYANPAGEM